MITKEYNTKEVAERIDILRKQHNLSVNKLATMAGVDTGNLSRSIKGKATFSDRVIMKIAHALNVSLDWLESGVGPMLSPTVASPQEVGVGIATSNINGSNSPNVSQSIGTADALQRENEILRQQNEFLQKQVETLLSIVGSK